MDKIEQIQDAISHANRLESKLTRETTLIGGYTSDKIRHLLNNLGAISSNYLEIGVHRGATFISSVYKNDLETYIAIDNFSELAEDGTVKDELFLNCKKFGLNLILLDQDCFTITKKDILRPIDFYLYDGNHSYESQKKAITHFLPMMADEFILCVDDYDWDDVTQGTQNGIKESGINVLFETHLKSEGLPQDGWWNGFYVALIHK